MAGSTINVSILANAKDLKAALGDSEGALSKFGKVAGAVAIAAGVALGALGVQAVKNASQLEQAMGGLGAVFKENTPQMEAFANKAAASVGLAKSEYASLATTLGAQLKNMGVSTDELAGRTDRLVTLGADLAAQFGGSTSDAVSALSSLLRGERDPIERYGVSINEAALKAKLAEMGLEGLSGEAERNAKLLATEALLFQQTADAAGAFARESTTLAGTQARLTAGLTNLSATFGTALLPAVTAVTGALGALVNGVSTSEWFTNMTAGVASASNSFADFVFGVMNGTTSLSAALGSIDFGALIINIFTALISMREALVTGILAAIPAIVSGIASAVPQIVSGLAALLSSVVSLIATSAPILLDAAVQLFQGLLNAVGLVLPQLITTITQLIPQLVSTLVAMVPQLLAGALQLFQGLINALVVVIPLLVTSLLAMLPALVTSLLSMIPMILETAILLFQSLVEALPIIIPKLITAIVEMLPKLIETILNMIPMILDAAVNLFTALVESLPIILPLLITAIIELLPKIITTVIGMLPRLLEAAVKLFTGIVTAIPKIIPELIPALLNLLPAIIGAIIGMVPQLVQSGVQLIQGLIRGIGQMAGAVGSALINIAKNAIGGFLSFLGIKSPSRLMMKYGKNIGQGVAIGIGKSESVVSSAMDHLSGLVATGFNPSMSANELALSVSGSGSRSSGATINITVNGGMDSGAEIGRRVKEALNEYERSGGRL